MGDVCFSSMDAAIVYSIPKPGTTLTNLVRCYCYINRAAPPSHATLSQCLGKTLAAGVVKRSVDGQFAVDGKWYDYVHQFDGTAANEIESMLAFEEVLTAREWPKVCRQHFALDVADYTSALNQIGGR